MKILESLKLSFYKASDVFISHASTFTSPNASSYLQENKARQKARIDAAAAAGQKSIVDYAQGKIDHPMQ